MEEHRIFYRLNEPFTLRFELGTETHTAKGKDLSGGGARFCFSQPMPLDEVVALVLVLSEDAAPVRCQAKVVSCLPGEETGRFDVGLTFLDLTARDRDRLLTHIGQKRQQSLENI